MAIVQFCNAVDHRQQCKWMSKRSILQYSASLYKYRYQPKEERGRLGKQIPGEARTAETKSVGIE